LEQLQEQTWSLIPECNRLNGELPLDLQCLYPGADLAQIGIR
jgi:hypothetical protein